MIGSPMPEECTARLQLVAGFNRLAAAVVRIQEEARAAHDGPKKQRVLAEAGERFRAGLKVCHASRRALPRRSSRVIVWRLRSLECRHRRFEVQGLAMPAGTQSCSFCL